MLITIPIKAGLAMVLAAVAVGAPAQSVITKITSKTIGEGVEIAIQGESLKAPKTYFLSGGNSYVMDFNAELKVNPATRKVRDFGVDYYNFAQFSVSPNIARLYFKLDEGVKPVLSNKDGTWFVRINVKAQEERPLTATDLDRAAMEKAIAVLAKPDSSPTPPAKPAASDVSEPVVAAGGETSKQSKPSAIKEGTIVRIDSKTVYESNGSAASSIKPRSFTPVTPSRGFGVAKVSVVVDRTDVLDILDALAGQANVNIISSPLVSPTDTPIVMTMKMVDVELDFAMTAVTSLAGLRYTRIGNTYIVSPAEVFPTMAAKISQLYNVNYETRVVPIVSGESAQIREATLKAVPQDGSGGYYEIIDPASTEDVAGGAMAAGAPAVAGPVPGTVPVGGTAAPTQGSTPTKRRAMYIMLVGETSRLDMIEAYVLDLDERINASFSLSGTAALGTVVVPIFSGETVRIKKMLTDMIARNPRSADYTIEEAAVKELAEAEESTHMILLAGPRSELETLERLAITFDDQLCVWAGIETSRDPKDMEKFYEVVDLMFIEPTLAAFDLKGRIRGLYVTVLPDPVTPGIIGQADETKQDKPADDTGAQATAGRDELKRQIGREQMRLVLRGTRRQIDEAKDYLMAVDIAPRQVAVELRVMELTKDEALKVGLDWSILTSGRLVTFRMNQGTGNPITVPGNFAGTYNYQGSDTFSVLGALDQVTTDRNLIAKPNVLITDGRSAHLFVGDTVRYIESIQATQNGTTVTTAEINVGVTVDMMARIGANGKIAFQLMQNYSILNGFTPVPGGGSLPQTSDRTTEMYVNMLDGETIALGGLILHQDRYTESGIPLLKDIPLIGIFFKRIDKTKERTEIVFFLTAKIVTDENRPNAAVPSDMRKDVGGEDGGN